METIKAYKVNGTIFETKEEAQHEFERQVTKAYLEKVIVLIGLKENNGYDGIARYVLKNRDKIRKLFDIYDNDLKKDNEEAK